MFSSETNLKESNWLKIAELSEGNTKKRNPRRRTNISIETSQISDAQGQMFVSRMNSKNYVSQSKINKKILMRKNPNLIQRVINIGIQIKKLILSIPSTLLKRLMKVG